MRVTVLGVDPGTRSTGYGLVCGEGQKITLLEAGTITSEKTSFPQLLREMYLALRRLIEAHRPDEVAVEEAFVHRNPRVALETGGVRGVALLAAAEAGITVGEYSSREVKQSVAGRGGAGKEQVAYMVRALLGPDAGTLDMHATDALAVALCHLWRRDRARKLGLEGSEGAGVGKSAPAPAGRVRG